jgi:hypothetical protein
MDLHPFSWLSREITSYPLGSEMEASMKPESTIGNENEARAAAPAPAPAPTPGAAAGQRGPERVFASASTVEEIADRYEKIQIRAYELFLQRGSRDGGDVMDWLDAEQELDAAQPEKSFRAGAGGTSN